MIFEGLNKLRRNSIMTSIVLMAAGIILIICPEPYITALISSVGSVMIIVSIVMILDFMDSNKALIHFAYLTGALILGIAGIAVLVYEMDVLYVIAWLFGAFLVIDGVNGIIHTLVYARRSQRKAWWTLIPLDAVLVILGLIVFLNPFWDSPGPFLKVIGWMILFSAAVSALRLVWDWPLKSE